MALTPFEVLTKRWEAQRPSPQWTAQLQKDIGEVLAANKFGVDLLRETDCRQSLCRIALESNGIAGIKVKDMLEGQHLAVTYVQEPMTDEYVAFLDRNPPPPETPKPAPTVPDEPGPQEPPVRQ